MRKTTMFLAGLAIAAPALAVSVPATGDATVALPGVTSAADPSLATLNVSDQVVTFSTPAGVTPAVSGKIQIRVAKSNTTGGLIYSYRITNNASSGASVRALNVTGFPAMAYDANWRPDGLGTVSPKSLQASGSGAARVLSFQFDGIAPGKDSKFIFIKTTAKTSDSATTTARIKFSVASSGSVDIKIPKPKF